MPEPEPKFDLYASIAGFQNQLSQNLVILSTKQDAEAAYALTVSAWMQTTFALISHDKANRAIKVAGRA